MHDLLHFLFISLLFEQKEWSVSGSVSSAFDSAVRERLQKDPPTHSHHMSSKSVWELDHTAAHTHTYSTANGPQPKIPRGRVTRRLLWRYLRRRANTERPECVCFTSLRFPVKLIHYIYIHTLLLKSLGSVRFLMFLKEVSSALFI